MWTYQPALSKSFLSNHKRGVASFLSFDSLRTPFNWCIASYVSSPAAPQDHHKRADVMLEICITNSAIRRLSETAKLLIGTLIEFPMLNIRCRCDVRNKLDWKCRGRVVTMRSWSRYFVLDTTKERFVLHRLVPAFIYWLNVFHCYICHDSVVLSIFHFNQINKMRQMGILSCWRLSCQKPIDK